MAISGKIPLEQIHIAHDATREAFRREMERLTKAAGQHPKRKLILYFSGHSDDRGLHMIDGLISKEELQATLSEMRHPAKVIILDSCYSGALAAKGVSRATEFQIPVLDYDEPSGSVFLTASSARTSAFESSALEGSVFTHFIVEGLYGQADANRDGFVTIDELYQYAYAKTKWQSSASPDFAQRPEFVSSLRGEGALVLSYPAQTTGRLVLEDKLAGDVALRAPSGLVTFRLFKIAGREIALDLPSGSYEMTVKGRTEIGRQTIWVTAPGVTNLTEAGLLWSSAHVEGEIAKGASFGSTVSGLAGIRRGSSSGEEPGPVVGTRYNSKPLADGRWLPRWTAELDLYTNNRSSDGEEAKTFGAGVNLGLRIEHDTRFLGLGFAPLLAAGEDYRNQEWQGSNGRKARYAAWSPALSAGVELFTVATARRWGLNLKREVIAAKSLHKDSLRLYATCIGVVADF